MSLFRELLCLNHTAFSFVRSFLLSSECHTYHLWLFLLSWHVFFVLFLVDSLSFVSTSAFRQGDAATLFSFNATTVDGVFSIRWNMCSAQYTYPNTNGVMVTPNNTKIDVQIANFPYVFLV
jgi:hypothetical protein